MDWLLEYSTDISVVLMTFFITLTILHIVFVWRFPLSGSQWKLAEYVWVALAMASIIGLLEEARFLKADTNVVAAEEQAEQKIDALENWFEVYTMHACEDGPDLENSEQLCRWTKVKSSELRLVLANEEFPADVPRNLLSGLDRVRGAIGEIDKTMVRAHLTNYHDARDAYLLAQRNAQRSSYSSAFTSLAPLLFALAVALKFTKVTGEYRLLRKTGKY